MLYKKTLISTLLVSLCTSYLSAQTKTIDLDDLNGNWHLRTMDGKEVRKARAILDFDSENKKLSGFDGCNPISGDLKISHDTRISSKLTAAKMECRQSIHRYVSKRLHKAVKEGFTVTKATKNGVNGILIKSSSHELFFKWMSS